MPEAPFYVYKLPVYAKKCSLSEIALKGWEKICRMGA